MGLQRMALVAWLFALFAGYAIISVTLLVLIFNSGSFQFSEDGAGRVVAVGFMVASIGALHTIKNPRGWVAALLTIPVVIVFYLLSTFTP